MKTQIIEIKTGSTPINQIVEAVQGDSGRVLRCIISDMSIPSGSTARFYAVKPSGAEIYNDCAIDGQAVVIRMTTQMLAEVGTLNGQIEVTNSGKTVTSFSFCVNVIKNIKSNSAIESSNEFTALDNALKDAEGAAYKAVSEYAAAKGLTTGATPKQVEQIEQNTLGIDELKADLVEYKNVNVVNNNLSNLCITDGMTIILKRNELYRLSSPITLINAKIIGNGATIEYIGDDEIDSLILSNDSIFIDDVKINCANKCRFGVSSFGDIAYLQSVTVVNSGLTDTVYSAGINIFVQNATILNCKVNNGNGCGIILGNNNSFDYKMLIRISNCEFSLNKFHGILNWSETCKVTSCVICSTVCNNNEVASGFACHFLDNAVIDSCNSNFNGEHGVVFEDCSFVKILNSTLNNNGSCGVKLQSDISKDLHLGVSHCEISNNIICNNVFDGVNIGELTNDVLIQSNIVYGNDNSISLNREGYNDAYNNIFVLNNRLHSSKTLSSVLIIKTIPSNFEFNNIVDGKPEIGFRKRNEMLLQKIEEVSDKDYVESKNVLGLNNNGTITATNYDLIEYVAPYDGRNIVTTNAWVTVMNNSLTYTYITLDANNEVLETSEAKIVCMKGREDLNSRIINTVNLYDLGLSRLYSAKKLKILVKNTAKTGAVNMKRFGLCYGNNVPLAGTFY